MLLCIIDSAMLSAMLIQPDTGALLRFLQHPNHIDVDHGCSALTNAGRYAELAALHHSCGRHEEGLTLLQTLSQSADTLVPPVSGSAAELRGLPGAWAAVR